MIVTGMGRWRREEGQSSTDYAGFLAVIGFVFVAVSRSGSTAGSPAQGDPPQPAHVDDFVEMENDGTEHTDYGGVHYNSGIPNHAYYLLVQAIGRDHAEQIVYQAVTENLDSDANFEDFRTAMLQAARDLYGQDSTDFKGVNDAFAAVGLDGSWEAPDIEGC